MDSAEHLVIYISWEEHDLYFLNKPKQIEPRKLFYDKTTNLSNMQVETLVAIFSQTFNMIFFIGDKNLNISYMYETYNGSMYIYVVMYMTKKKKSSNLGREGIWNPAFGR